MLILSIDIGGTKILYAVINSDKDNKIVYSLKLQTEEDNFIENLISNIEKIIHRYKVSICIIAAAGFIDYRRQNIIYSPNIQYIPSNLKDIIKDKVGSSINIYLVNDVDASCYYEYINLKSDIEDIDNKVVCAINFGTGIGSSLIYHGTLYYTDTHSTEFGHMVICTSDNKGEIKLCKCGQYGCWEAYASALSLNKMMLDINIDFINSEAETYELDTFKRVMNQYLDYLILGLKNITTIISPDIIVLGGGLSMIKDTIYKDIKDKFYNTKAPLSYYKNMPSVYMSNSNNTSGVIGAVLMYIHKII